MNSVHLSISLDMLNVPSRLEFRHKLMHCVNKLGPETQSERLLLYTMMLDLISRHNRMQFFPGLIKNLLAEMAEINTNRYKPLPLTDIKNMFNGTDLTEKTSQLQIILDSFEFYNGEGLFPEEVILKALEEICTAKEDLEELLSAYETVKSRRVPPSDPVILTSIEGEEL